MSVIAIVGRPNVGKSTLFNRLVGRRAAIVEDTPGVTRDRHYAQAVIEGKRATLIDTGGLEPESGDQLLGFMAAQVDQAVTEADLIIFVADAHEGILPTDHEIANFLRRRSKDVIVAVNKVDGPKYDDAVAEFYGFGFEQVFPISAEHKVGMAEFLDEVASRLPEEADALAWDEGEIRVAVLGRPNVGKSSMVNAILGTERVVVSPIAGTTRDAVDTRVEIEGKPYLLIDTAGIRRKSKVEQGVERWSVIRALRAIDRAQVCMLMVDGQEGLTDQDLKVLDLIMRGGRAALICLNKWDLVDKDHTTFDETRKDIALKLGPHRHIPVLSTSALTGQRVHKVFEYIDKLHAESIKRISTSQLNRFLEDAMRELAPPVIGRKRSRIYYASQVRVAPPVFTLFSSYPEGIPVHYQRYLTNKLRATFGFDGVPLRLFLRQRKRSEENK